MLKVVVFGAGWGGELFADYLEKEVGVLEIVREVDWLHGNYSKYAKKKIRTLAEEKLEKYIGRADLIILASYTISEAALEYLSEQHPEQKFIGFKPRLARCIRNDAEELVARELKEYKAQLGVKRRIEFALSGYGRVSLNEAVEKFLKKNELETVIVLASETVKNSRCYKDDLKKLNGKYKVLAPKCEDIAEGIDSGAELSSSLLWSLPEIKNVKAVLIYGTSFMRMKEILTRIYGWRTRIYDDFQASTEEICRVLGMKEVRHS